MHRSRIISIVFCFLSFAGFCSVAQGFELSPSQYGNLLINRLSVKYGQPWVTFSHWSHRARYTCRVCHLELGFEMKVNYTEITEEGNRRGEFCGACHNGKVAFGHTEGNCSKCHNGNIAYGEEKFSRLASLPVARYGNRIDWTEALNKGLITPKQSIFDENYAPIHFNTVIWLEAKGVNINPAVFPHQVHNQWLDCANCHPDTFNIKRATTGNISMKHIHEGRACGTCHSRVAFPANDCNRCHFGKTRGQ